MLTDHQKTVNAQQTDAQGKLEATTQALADLIVQVNSQGNQTASASADLKALLTVKPERAPESAARARSPAPPASTFRMASV